MSTRDDYRRALAARLAEAQEATGKSVYRICRETGLPQSSWYRIQRGQSGMGAEKAMQLADALGVTPAWLLFGEKANRPVRTQRDDELVRLAKLVGGRGRAIGRALVGLAEKAASDPTVARLVQDLDASLPAPTQEEDADRSRRRPRRRRGTG